MVEFSIYHTKDDTRRFPRAHMFNNLKRLLINE